MSDFIKREDALKPEIELLPDISGLKANQYEVFLVEQVIQIYKNYLRNIPAADVRPVVLCRDCKMASPCSDDREMYCTLNHCYKTTNYFCADGRKKNENPN